MINKAIFFFVPLLFIFGTAYTQSDSMRSEQKKIHYTNSFLSGGLFAEKGKGNSLTVSTFHGVRYGRWMAGAGMGYDSYDDWNVIPLMGTVSFDFCRIQKNALFIQFTAGYTKPWPRDTEMDGVPSKDVNGGYMINPLAGYRMNVDRYSLYISAGYRFQRINYSYKNQYWGWYAGVPSSSTYVQQDMSRVSIQIGFGLH